MKKSKPNFWWDNFIRTAGMQEATNSGELQRFVIDFCKNHLHWEVWRNNTGKRGGVSYGKTGSGDVIGFTDKGKFVSIEVKFDKDKPSPKQLEFREKVLLSTGWGVMVKTKVDFLEQVRDYINNQNKE